MSRLIGTFSGPLVIFITVIAIAGRISAAENIRPPDEKAVHDTLIEALRRDAALGNERAQYVLGCFFNGEQGFPKDPNQAARWWGKAAERGMAEAQYCLGLSYFLGQGVPKDAAVAVKWWRKAADQDLPDAQYFVGLCYRKGLGLQKSPSLAIYWLRKAAGQGNEAALAELQRVGSPSG